ncbi:MAG: response regulator [Planctomycetes bacterium]|nr:response regulator [Planctomycetota bacterium]
MPTAAGARKQTQMSQDTPTTLPKSVLVAEDEHLIATNLCSHLRALGCRPVGPARDGAAAVEVAKSELPEMALLDIRMPQRDGLETASILWELGIPSVIITAYSEPQYVDRAQQTGVFGYLLKPVAGDLLRVALSVAWARAQQTESDTKRVHQLENLLANRRIIEQAKWKLVETRRLTEPEAHAHLQTEARNQRKRLIDIAAAIIGTSPAGDGAAGN